MEWEDDFGIKNLFDSDSDDLPSSSRKDKEVPGGGESGNNSSDSGSEEEEEEGDLSNKEEEKGSSSSSDDDDSAGKQNEEVVQADLQPPPKSNVGGSAAGRQESGAPPQEEDVSSKVKRYLEGIRARTTLQIRERLGHDNIIYNSIQLRYKQETGARNLMCGELDHIPVVEGLVDIGDGRILSGGLKIDIGAKKVVCTSFDNEWCCFRCVHHKDKPAFKIRGVADSSCSPQIVVLADQAFPACLPSSSTKDCLKILLVEGGRLRELAAEFIERLGNRRVPPASAILLFSLTNLADVGVVGYVEEMLATIQTLKSKLGMATRVQPLPPVVLGGVDEPSTTRSLIELANWSLEYFSEDMHFLKTATLKARDIMQEIGSGTEREWEFRRLVLPSKVALSGKSVWSSGGPLSDKWPATLKPLSVTNERVYVTELIADVRMRLALDLEPHPVIDRLVGSQSEPKRRVDFMVVGSSNGRRLAKTLQEAGHSVCLVCEAGWTVTRENCSKLATTICSKIKEEDPAVVVLFLLDNSMFYTRVNDGGRALPKKLADGKFHVVGEMVVASRDIQTEHYNTLRPVLDAVGRIPCLIVAPLQRYIVAGCCDDVRHVANRLDRGFQDDQKQQLALLVRNLKAFLFNNRRGNMRVVDVAQDLVGFENADIWCVDPVHPIDQVYRRIASGVLKMAANQHQHDEATSGKRRRPEGGEGDEAQRRRPAEPQRRNWQDGGHEDDRAHSRRNWYEDRGREEEAGDNRRPREFQNSRLGREEYYEDPAQGRGRYNSRGGRGLYHKRGSNRGWRRPY
jgi:hypothetical protein